MRKSDHFAFRVSDMDRSIAFYSQSLGLKLLFRERDEKHGEEYAFLELAGGNLELIETMAEEPYELPEIRHPYCPHLALHTESMDETLKTLGEKQIPIVKGPLQIDGKVRWVYTHDPDNNIIEFVEWL